MGRQSMVLVSHISKDYIMNYKHGKSGTVVHNTWMRMWDRCRNDRQGTYGKRGIRVCDRWKSFDVFYQDMGEPNGPGYSIDRIDNDGHYEPDNCRWATRRQQSLNTSRNTRLSHLGKEMTISEWSERTGIKASTICRRIYNYGWSIGEALSIQPTERLPIIKPWTRLGMSRSSWYRAGRPML